MESDLSGLALDLALWGAADASDLAFLDPPPKGAMAEAQALLRSLGALGEDGRITAEGRSLARLALPPRLAHMMLTGAGQGRAARAALIAAALTERGLGGTSVDLHDRLEALARDRGRRAEDAKALAARWARQAERAAEPEARRGSSSGALSDGALLLAAYPERLAKRRGGVGEFRLVSGRGVYVDPADPLARADWLVAADLGSGAARDRILLAVALTEDELLAAAEGRIETADIVETDAAGPVKAKRVRRIGALVLDEREIAADAAVIERALLDQALKQGLAALPWGDQAEALRARIAFLRALEGDPWPDLSDAALGSRAEEWLAGALTSLRSLSALRPDTLDAALRALIPWDLLARLDRLAPVRFTAPTGSSFAIDYRAEAGPRVEVRVQELFGLSAHPMLAEGRVPLTLALTSPARRPIQVTKDLPGFWRGSWAEVRKEMRGRYPKHPWPDDPVAAPPTTRAKPRP